MAKTKTLARNHPVPQNREDCDQMIRDLGEIRRTIGRIEADMNDQMAETKEVFEKLAEPLREKVEELTGGIEAFCAVNRDALTGGGKVKFHKFANGEVNWRKRPPKVNLRNIDLVIERLKENGLRRFIRTSEAVNKEAVLDEPEAVKAIKGITVGSEGEDFVIEPFETELNAAKA